MVGLTLLVAVLASCDTASQEVEPVVSPDGYPMATFSTDFTGTEVNEGDVITYSVVFDKPIDRSVTFQVTPTDGDAEGDVDYVATPGVVQPYTTEAEISIAFTADDDPEAAETLSFEIGATSLADKYLVHQDVVNPTNAVTINSVNDPTLLTIKFEWDVDPHDLDLDLVTAAGFFDGDTLSAWGTGGAGSGNPEFDYSIWLADPVDVYFVSMMDWGAGMPFNYVLTLGLPNGTNQIIEGSFNPETAYDDYEVDIWDRWGNPDAFRLLEVEVDGSDAFTITVL